MNEAGDEREERGEKEERPAERERDDGRGVPVTPEEEAAQDGEDSSHGPPETAVLRRSTHGEEFRRTAVAHLHHVAAFRPDLR